MTPAEFIAQAYAAAKSSGHLFPAAAACEAAWASKYGTTQSAEKANNLFDFRVPAKVFRAATVTFQTTKGCNSRLAFPSYEACFAYRAQMMDRVTMFYRVKAAKTIEQYLFQMRRLSSDPQYDAKIMVIYNQYKAALA